MSFKLTKVQKKLAAMMMCTVIGLMSCLPVNAAESRGHEHTIATRTVDHHFEQEEEDCSHCAICVTCKDWVQYEIITVEVYCTVCNKVELRYTDKYETARSCACSNSACCN